MISLRLSFHDAISQYNSTMLKSLGWCVSSALSPEFLFWPSINLITESKMLIVSNNTLCLWRKSFIIIPITNIFTNHKIVFKKTQVIVLIDMMKGVFVFPALASLSIAHSWLWMIQITACARILWPQPADICSLSTCTLTKTNAGYFFWSWPWKSCQSPIYVYFFSDFRKKNSVFH